MAKILGILTALILAVSALVAIKNNARLVQEIDNEIAISKELKKNQDELADAQAILRALPDEIAGVEAQTVAALEREAELKEEGEGFKKQIASKTAQIATNEDELQKTREVIGQAGNVDQLASKMKQMQAESEELTQTVDSREANLANLTAEASAAQTRMDSLNETVNFITRTSSHPSLKTRITSIYPNWGFVTLADGMTAGVAGGSPLDIVRDNEVIAKLLVTTVERNSASASIVPDSIADGVTLMIGDRVTAGSDVVDKAAAN